VPQPEDYKAILFWGQQNKSLLSDIMNEQEQACRDDAPSSSVYHDKERGWVTLDEVTISTVRDAALKEGFKLTRYAGIGDNEDMSKTWLVKVGPDGTYYLAYAQDGEKVCEYEQRSIEWILSITSWTTENELTDQLKSTTYREWK